MYIKGNTLKKIPTKYTEKKISNMWKLQNFVSIQTPHVLPSGESYMQSNRSSVLPPLPLTILCVWFAHLNTCDVGYVDNTPGYGNEFAGMCHKVNGRAHRNNGHE